MNPLQADLNKLQAEHHYANPTGMRTPASPPRQASDLVTAPMPWMAMSQGMQPVAYGSVPPRANRARGASEDRKTRRRATHNMVERRRRDVISENIRQLDVLMPDDFDVVTSSVSASPLDRHSKSNVLKRGVAYVSYLHAEQAKHLKRIKELEQRVSQLEDLLEGGYS